MYSKLLSHSVMFSHTLCLLLVVTVWSLGSAQYDSVSTAPQSIYNCQQFCISDSGCSVGRRCEKENSGDRYGCCVAAGVRAAPTATRVGLVPILPARQSATSTTTRVTQSWTTPTSDEQSCAVTTDCAPGLSCFNAQQNKRGCCLPIMKPNEVGCTINEQCSRACKTSYCQKESSPFTASTGSAKGKGKCRCEKGNHFLFGKCWRSCPKFAEETPQPLADGQTVCVIRKGNVLAARRAMHRMKRQAVEQSARIFC